MKRFLIILLMIPGIVSSLTAQNHSIDFHEGHTLAELKELANQQNKLIFIDFYTAWCGPCKQMDREVYVDSRVADFYNANFICIRIDAEKGEGIYLTKLYGLQAYPTFLFVSADGKMVHRSCAYHDQKQFILLGKDALDPEKQFSRMLDELTVKKEKEETAKIIKMLSSYCMPTDKAASSYLSTQKDADLFSPENWRMICLYTYGTRSREFQFLMQNRDKFSTLYGDSAVTQKISKSYLEDIVELARDTTADKENRFSSIKEKIKKANIPEQERFLVKSDLAFYKASGNLQKFFETASVAIPKYYWDDAVSLNLIAMVFIDSLADRNNVRQVIVWVKRSIELHDWPGNNDTYANLLFEIGEVDRAIEVENHAVQLAKDLRQDNYKDYESVIDKFKRKR